MAILGKFPDFSTVNQDGTLPLDVLGWMEEIRKIQSYSFTTANRPIVDLFIGRPGYDETLGIPVWINSLAPTVWKDAAGNTV